MTLDAVSDGCWSALLGLLWHSLVMVGGFLLQGPLCLLDLFVNVLAWTAAWVTSGGWMMWDVGTGFAAMGRTAMLGLWYAVGQAGETLLGAPGQLARVVGLLPSLVWRLLWGSGELFVAMWVGLYHFFKEVIWDPALMVIQVYCYPFALIWATFS